MEKRNLPNATAVLILGICSILTCCCYGIIGLILGIVALVLAKKDLKLYQENPELYLNYQNLNIGKILSIIGVVLSSIYIIFMAYILVAVGPEGLKEFQQNLQNKLDHQQEQNQ